MGYLFTVLVARDRIAAEPLRTTYDIRYDTRCYFNVRLKIDMSQIDRQHRTNN